MRRAPAKKTKAAKVRKRPTKFKQNLYPVKVQPRLATIRCWRQAGLTEEQIAENLGVALSSLSLYKTQHSELLDALKTGKDDANALVINALMKKALGYEYTETKTIVEKKPNGQLDILNARVETTVKHQPPDTGACAFWLKNRAGWYDRQELTGADGAPLVPDNVVFVFPDNGHGPGSAKVKSESSEKVGP